MLLQISSYMHISSLNGHYIRMTVATTRMRWRCRRQMLNKNRHVHEYTASLSLWLAKSTLKIMKVAFGFLLGSLNAQNIQKLEEYVVQHQWKTDDITSLMRSDSLLQTGDTRELIYGMLSYRYESTQ